MSDKAAAQDVGPPLLTIMAADATTMDAFMAYLADHMTDNGAPGLPYFQPAPHGQVAMPQEKRDAFARGLAVPVGEAGWRRLWLAKTPDGAIAGHVDLSARSEPFARHRCLLGMGVHRDHRRAGLGRRLLGHAEAWAWSTETGIAWIDLKVMSANLPAIALYRAAGYAQTGATEDMFRIDGVSLSDIGMSKCLTAMPR